MPSGLVVDIGFVGKRKLQWIILHRPYYHKLWGIFGHIFLTCFHASVDFDSVDIKDEIWASLKKLADEGGQSNSMSDFQAIDIEGLFTRDIKPCGYIWSFNSKEKHAKSPENHSLP
jgi:hypothetical protein